MNKVEEIRKRLIDAFAPTYLEVIDESDQHKDHAGYQGGGRHFAIIIDADCFQSLSRVAIHRQIYQVLGDFIPEKIHALRIKIV